MVVDCESTGLDPKTDALVEIATVATSIDNHLQGMWATLVYPGRDIPPEASAIHGITYDDVWLAPSTDQALHGLADFVSRFVPFTPTGHNFTFDYGFLTADPKSLNVFDERGLCTKRLAMKLWPGYPSYKNQALRYRRKLVIESFVPAHRALGDALVTAALLIEELTSNEFRATGIEDVAALIEYCDAPILLELMPFGRHKGEPIAKLPRGYIDWCLRLPDLSSDMRFSLERAIA